MADCCSAPGLMPFTQAKQNLLDAVSQIKQTELVAISSADKRVLAKDVVSPINVPAHNNSAMDGYALRDEQLADNQAGQLEFKMVGSALAGQPYAGQLKDGECIRIMTGAVVPDSANSVVMQENVSVSEQAGQTQIKLTKPTVLNNNIRFAGEDIQQNQLVFTAGHSIKAIDIGLLASLGMAQVEVYRPVKVAIFSTGDELKSPGETLNQGDIYESNSQVIMPMLTRLGMDVVNLGIIEDDKEAIREAFLKADEIADVVISSGGVSVGDADYTKDVLDEIGDINFWKVAMKPGKPFAFGKLPNSAFFGLPGNPVSATVTFHQLVVPTILYMAGTEQTEALPLTAITTAKINKRPGRMDFQRGVANVNQQGQLEVKPLAGQGSGILSSISRANCYIVLAAESGAVAEGETVTVNLFDALLS